jgi:hypothetical protein
MANGSGRERIAPYIRLEIEEFLKEILALLDGMLPIFVIIAALVFFIITRRLWRQDGSFEDFVEFTSIQPNPPTLWTVVDFDSLTV